MGAEITPVKMLADLIRMVEAAHDSIFKEVGMLFRLVFKSLKIISLNCPDLSNIIPVLSRAG